MSSVDHIYGQAVDSVLSEGVLKPTRTGVQTISKFFVPIALDMGAGRFPLLTTKTVNFSAIVYELLWFLSGEPDIRLLKGKTKIWDAWADESGNLDTAYGNYWRRFPSPKGAYDQIARLRFLLRHEPTSRRMVVSAWEPSNAHTSQLPPCHYTFCVNVTGDRLHLHWTQRSCDMALGVPFNIASYALLLMLLAREAGLELGTLAGSLLDAHVYTSEDPEVDHVIKLREQLHLQPFPGPTLSLIGTSNLDALVQMHLREDVPLEKSFLLQDYHAHPPIKFKVAV